MAMAMALGVGLLLYKVILGRGLCYSCVGPGEHNQNGGVST